VRALVLAAPAASTAALDRVDRMLAAPVVGPVTSGAMMAGVAIALAAGPVRERIAARLSIEPAYLRRASRRLVSSRARAAFMVEQRAMFRELPALERRLSSIAAPTVVVTGSRDAIVPPWASRAVAGQIPGARLEVVEGAGHLLPHRHAEQLAAVIAGIA
jgi:pimeloyl-ACP methyl ester carboxylesterase